MVYLADALMEQKEFGKAEAHYRRALELRKTLAKGRGAGNHKELQAETDVLFQLLPFWDDIDYGWVFLFVCLFFFGGCVSLWQVRYRMHLCHLALKQPVQALIVLQGIPAKLRSVSVNMALGKLYILNGMDRSAVSSFKEVRRSSSKKSLLIESSRLVMTRFPHQKSQLDPGTK